MEKERITTKRERKMIWLKWNLYLLFTEPQFFFKKLHKKIFKGCYCKSCGGRLRITKEMKGFDAHADHNIYKCEECGKEFI